jgi:hypothetical protein
MYATLEKIQTDILTAAHRSWGAFILTAQEASDTKLPPTDQPTLMDSTLAEMVATIFMFSPDDFDAGPDRLKMICEQMTASEWSDARLVLVLSMVQNETRHLQAIWGAKRTENLLPNGDHGKGRFVGRMRQLRERIVDTLCSRRKRLGRQLCLVEVCCWLGIGPRLVERLLKEVVFFWLFGSCGAVLPTIPPAWDPLLGKIWISVSSLLQRTTAMRILPNSAEEEGKILLHDASGPTLHRCIRIRILHPDVLRLPMINYDQGIADDICLFERTLYRCRVTRDFIPLEDIMALCGIIISTRPHTAYIRPMTQVYQRRVTCSYPLHDLLSEHLRQDGGSRDGVSEVGEVDPGNPDANDGSGTSLPLYDEERRPGVVCEMSGQGGGRPAP